MRSLLTYHVSFRQFGQKVSKIWSVRWEVWHATLWVSSSFILVLILEGRIHGSQSILLFRQMVYPTPH